MGLEKKFLSILLTVLSILGANTYGQGLQRPQPQFIIDGSTLSISDSINLLFAAPIQPIAEFKQVRYVDRDLNILLTPYILRSGATLSFESTRGTIGARAAISVGCNVAVLPIPQELLSFQIYGALLKSGQAILARDFNNVTGVSGANSKNTVLIVCQ